MVEEACERKLLWDSDQRGGRRGLSAVLLLHRGSPLVFRIIYHSRMYFESISLLLLLLVVSACCRSWFAAVDMLAWRPWNILLSHAHGAFDANSVSGTPFTSIYTYDTAAAAVARFLFVFSFFLFLVFSRFAVAGRCIVKVTALFHLSRVIRSTRVPKHATPTAACTFQFSNNSLQQQ